jgi:hypothetical protein
MTESKLLSDWQTFITNAFDLSGLSDRDAFQLGDLDFDGDSDFEDFRHFKTAFDLVNGLGAFASIGQVPEPHSFLLASMVLAIGGTRRQHTR